MTAPKNCFKECEDFEKDCGRRLYAAQVASLLVSEKIHIKMYILAENEKLAILI